MAVLVAVGCAEGGTSDDTVDDPLGAPQDRDTIVPLEPTSTEDPVGQLGTSDDVPDATGQTVEVQAIAFEPESVTVPAGTPVTWVSRDDVAHTVTSGTPVVDPDVPSGVFDEDLPAGGSATVTIDEPGTYPYYCEIHQAMTAQLVVE